MGKHALKAQAPRHARMHRMWVQEHVGTGLNTQVGQADVSADTIMTFGMEDISCGYWRRNYIGPGEYKWTKSDTERGLRIDGIFN